MPTLLLQAFTLEYLGCAEKEELFASSDEEELLSAHGIAGKSVGYAHTFSLAQNPHA